MNLPFFKKKEKNRKPFLGLLLKENDGIIFAIHEEMGHFSILDNEHFSYTDGWEHIAEDIDEILFKLENSRKIQFNETIFFLYSHLIDSKGEEIKKLYFDKIKNLVKNLELKALGYIECYEGVVRFLEHREELPLTGIIVELDKTQLTMIVYKGGKIVFSKGISRTEDLVSDLSACLDEIKGKVLLPARIILYDSHALTQESTKIITHRWSDELFIQLPRVEVIRENDISKELVGIFEEQVKSSSRKFHEPQDEYLHKEVMGFIIGEDLPADGHPPTKKISPTVPNLSTFFHRILHLLPKKDSLALPSRKRMPLLLGLFGFFLIGFGLFLNEYFLHQATVTVYVPSVPIETTIDIQTYEKSRDLGDLKITAASVSASFSQSKITTGKREVGEEARGEVTAYNFNSAEKTFSKGTVFSTGGLSFELDEDIKVASASLKSDFSAKLPGTAKGSLSAVLIGNEGNIGEGKIFTIADNPSDVYFAKNEKSFSGGSKKDVRTVSKQDMDDLKDEILEKAKSQRLAELNQNSVNNDNVILKDLTESVLVDSSFSKELGEEADSVTLKGKVTSTFYFYSKKELVDYLYDQLQDDLEKGFKVEKEKISYTIDKVQTKNQKTFLTIAVRTKSMKNINETELKNTVLRNTRENIGVLLKNMYGIQKFDLTVKQPLPFFQNLTPLFQKNLFLTISTL